MTINLYNTFGANEIHDKYITAFSQGLSNLGVANKIYPIQGGYVKSDLAILFGYGKNNTPGRQRRAIIEAHNDSSSTIIIERGFVRRESYYSVGYGNFNGRADFRNHDSPSDRWLDLKMSLENPDLSNNASVLLCGQVPWDAAVEHVNYKNWVTETYWFLKACGYDVCFKPHPLQPTAINFPGRTIGRKRLSNILPLFKFTVSFNSNSGVESIIAGVPSLAIDPGSMIYNITETNLRMVDKIKLPEERIRKQWACDIAYAQWTLDEMKDGLPQIHLGIA